MSSVSRCCKTDAADELLLTQARSGDDNAMGLLIERMSAIVSYRVAKFKSPAFETDDLKQEGMIGVLGALYSYRIGSPASLKTYVGVCVENRLQSVLRETGRKKQIPPGSLVEYEEGTVRSGISPATNPEEFYIAKEEASRLTSYLDSHLSHFENEVLRYHLIGCSYSEISQRLDKSPKAIDNALQRVRKKLKPLGSRHFFRS